jgi:hypothetical protein
VENYGKAGQDTDENVIGRTLFVCWINKAIDKHLEYVIFIPFHSSNGYGNAPEYYAIRRPTLHDSF